MRPRLLLVVLLAVTAAQAGAAPADAPTVSAADRKKLSAALRDGRALQRKHKLAAAKAAFERGLAISPDDPVLLGELGWTAYLTNDLASAEELTRKALAGEASPNVRAASLYNLGLIAEARGDKPGAAVFYGQSLRHRPNAVVRKALVKLDPAAAAELDPFAPARLEGPFVSLAAFCATQQKRKADRFGEILGCTCGEIVRPTSRTKLAPPFQQIEMFTRTCMQADSTNVNGGFGEVEYKLGVKLVAGWYVGAMDSQSFNRHCSSELHHHGISVETHGALLALVRYGIEGECAGGGNGMMWEGERLVAVGVGKSAVPSATPPIRLRQHDVSTSWETGEEKQTIEVELQLEPVWTDASLEMKGKTRGAGDAELGTHVIAFP
jgi:tetratricopeptide (TPR) repeat protein